MRENFDFRIENCSEQAQGTRTAAWRPLGGPAPRPRTRRRRTGSAIPAISSARGRGVFLAGLAKITKILQMLVVFALSGLETRNPVAVGSDTFDTVLL